MADKKDNPAPGGDPNPIQNRALKKGDVLVRATRSLAEDGVFYDTKSEPFVVTEERCAALGPCVKRVSKEAE